MDPKAPNPGAMRGELSPHGPPESEVEIVWVRTGTDAGVHG